MGCTISKIKKHLQGIYERGKALFTLGLFIQGKYFKDLKVGDIEDYLEFIKQPPESWCASKANLKKGGSLWRPFCEKGLSGASFLTATRAIKSLFSYLNDESYISANPLSLIKNILQKTMDVEISKIDIKKACLSVNISEPY